VQGASVLLGEAGHLGKVVVHVHLAELRLPSAAEDREGRVVAGQQASSVRGEVQRELVLVRLLEHLGHPELPHGIVVQPYRHFD